MFGTRGVLAGLALLSIAFSLIARVPIALDSRYADTVRIAILSNNYASGPDICNMLPPVGEQSRDFVLAALDTTHCKNIKHANAWKATFDTVLTMFGGKVPHVIVHINAGWAALSGPTFSECLTTAAQHNVGIVEIGDDDAAILGPVLGWATDASTPTWAPMSTGQWLDDSLDRLYIRLQPAKDIVIDSTKFPHLNGLLRNTVSVLKGDSTMMFLPYRPLSGNPSRCEADPDQYAIDSTKMGSVKFFGYQQGYNSMCDSLDFNFPDLTCDTVIGKPGQYKCITVFEDTIPISGTPGLRRAVALSFQPPFFKDSIAIQQLIYDAVMYASTVHMGNPRVAVRPDRGSPRFESALKMRRFVRITDLSGRMVFQGYADPDQLRAMSLRWRSGIYVVSTSAPGEIRSGKIVINR